MKKNRVLFWASTGFIFLFEGMMPLITLLFATEYATAGTKPLGYPDYFAYALIVCKVLGATAIILPQLPDKIKEWAYAGLTFNMIFAVISHVVVDGFLFVSFFPLIILAILAVSYYYNSKLKANGTT
ncbi:MAG TPA: DoxX family protein [Saprospiraceae bacterium]|nr:DoxX family protein [Saprospiraceae bacterium]